MSILSPASSLPSEVSLKAVRYATYYLTSSYCLKNLHCAWPQVFNTLQRWMHIVLNPADHNALTIAIHLTVCASTSSTSQEGRSLCLCDIGKFPHLWPLGLISKGGHVIFNLHDDHMHICLPSGVVLDFVQTRQSMVTVCCLFLNPKDSADCPACHISLQTWHHRSSDSISSKKKKEEKKKEETKKRPYSFSSAVQASWGHSSNFFGLCQWFLSQKQSFDICICLAHHDLKKVYVALRTV